jgi:hypothetical protein
VRERSVDREFGMNRTVVRSPEDVRRINQTRKHCGLRADKQHEGISIWPARSPRLFRGESQAATRFFLVVAARERQQRDYCADRPLYW